MHRNAISAVIAADVLITVHKLFIAGTAALFALYALMKLYASLCGDRNALVPMLVATTGAAGLALYLRWLFAKYRRT